MDKKATMPAGRFKATCLSVLDEVAETGRTVVITKRGRPVAMLSPVTAVQRKPLQGSIVEEGDLVSPLALDWDATH